MPRESPRNVLGCHLIYMNMCVCVCCPCVCGLQWKNTIKTSYIYAWMHCSGFRTNKADSAPSPPNIASEHPVKLTSLLAHSCQHNFNIRQPFCNIIFRKYSSTTLRANAPLSPLAGPDAFFLNIFVQAWQCVSLCLSQRAILQAATQCNAVHSVIFCCIFFFLCLCVCFV